MVKNNCSKGGYTMAAKKAKKKVQIFPIVNTIIMILFVIHLHCILC